MSENKKIVEPCSTLTLNMGSVGSNGFWEIRNQLNKFVETNFDALYEGATRLGMNIPRDYYAPERVQIKGTRLHEEQGLKYADGHKYSDENAPTEAQLRQTVEDLRCLITAATEDIVAPFVLNIVENEIDDSAEELDLEAKVLWLCKKYRHGYHSSNTSNMLSAIAECKKGTPGYSMGDTYVMVDDCMWDLLYVIGECLQHTITYK